MREQKIDDASGKVILFLSVTALLTVLTGYLQPPQPDEGPGAHIFQLSIVALAPAILLFLVTADRSQPWRNLRSLAVPALTLVLAFGALCYLEHHRDPYYVGRARRDPAAGKSA